MKTFNQFCSEAYQLDENVFLNTVRGAMANPVVRNVVGKTRTGRFVRSLALPQVPGPVGDLVDLGVSAATMGPTGVAVTGLQKAAKYAAPAGKAITKARTERDATARQALSTAPSTRGMTFADRERLVQGTRLKGV